LEPYVPNSSGGGRGGYSWSSKGADPKATAPGDCKKWGGNGRLIIGGLGGRPLPVSSSKLYFGGGGGAGNENSRNGGTGGNGGGLVFVVAGQMVTSGSGSSAPVISANGAPGGDTNSAGTNLNDAPGGGGGGGTTYLYLGTTLSGSLVVTATGGDGGTIKSTPVPTKEKVGVEVGVAVSFFNNFTFDIYYRI